MVDFERTKHTVGGRSILVTSWFDEGKQTWRASAPAYAHLGALLDTSRIDCASRNLAVERLSNLLARHFESSTG